MVNREQEVYTGAERDKRMKDSIELYQRPDGTWDIYDDKYDITIHCETKKDQDEAIAVLKHEEQVKEAIRKHNMEKLAQDEISNFEYEILKIYGVME